jgi:creatinine amidohydrolase/Fe(II)-dependent formamide hydrolase-like protein
MPLATDALIGDHLARELAERLGAFVAPTVRIGCSSHHLDFPGTLSIAEATFHAVVRDITSSLIDAGFKRIVLLPTHGGNFAPLATAVEVLDERLRSRVVAVTDLSLLLEIACIAHGAKGETPLRSSTQQLRAGSAPTDRHYPARPPRPRIVGETRPGARGPP